MKSRHKSQYTIRDVPAQLDQALRQKSRVAGESLNKVVLDLLSRGTGSSETLFRHHELDFLIGSWKEDPD